MREHEPWYRTLLQTNSFGHIEACRDAVGYASFVSDLLQSQRKTLERNQPLGDAKVVRYEAPPVNGADHLEGYRGTLVLTSDHRPHMLSQPRRFRTSGAMATHRVPSLSSILMPGCCPQDTLHVWRRGGFVLIPHANGSVDLDNTSFRQSKTPVPDSLQQKSEQGK